METVKLSIRKNDMVQVIAGREKGKTGKVLRVDSKNLRILIEKVNMMKRHVKPSQKNPQGGVLEKETPLHFSNVQLFCAKCNRGVRFGMKWVESKAKKGKKTAGAESKKSKVRVCKRCESELDAA